MNLIPRSPTSRALRLALSALREIARNQRADPVSRRLSGDGLVLVNYELGAFPPSWRPTPEMQRLVDLAAAP